MNEPSKSGLEFNPHIASAPLYVAGTSIEDTRTRFKIDEVTKLASNESLLGPSPRAVEAIQSALSELHRYPPAAPDALRQALAAHLGRGVTADHIALGNGASELIDMLARGFVGASEHIIICRPTFPMYDIATRRCGGEVRCADLDAAYAYDVDAILRAIDEQTRIIFLCTPNNPTGTLLTPQQADRLLAEIPDNVLVVIDESYRLFVADQDMLIDTTGYVLAHQNVVALNSFSKSYGLAGLRVGYALSAPQVSAYLQRLCQPFHFSELALCGAMAALEDQDFVDSVRRLTVEERGWLAEQMELLGLELIPSHANFVAARATYPAQTLYERLLPEGVIIRPLGLFYLPDWFRVTVGKREENARFIEALKRVLQTLSEEGIAVEHSSDDGKIAV